MSYWDSSALVPLCTKEPRSPLAGKMWRQFPAKFVSWTASVEILSALARIERENEITLAQRVKAESRLAKLERIIEIIQPESRIIELARTFPATYGLKGADSIQLASALVWCREFPKNKVFVSGDLKLLEVAETVGFTVHGI